MSKRAVTVANISGFYGDRHSAPLEMLDGGLVDVLTGDYLAELTMAILERDRRCGGVGYAKTFLAQSEEIMGRCLERGVKVVVNAGGLNPGGLARALREQADRLGLSPRIAWVEGDDVMTEVLSSAPEMLKHVDTGEPIPTLGFAPRAANAYLGAWGIVEALNHDADIVICPRVTDASLVVGPAAWWHRWSRTQWDELAGAVAAGHVIDCSTQATGGNYPFLDELAPAVPGFPLAEISSDGSAVISKHPGTGGAVTIGTVTAQLVYEIGRPEYLNPDVVARFDTLELVQDGADRVRITGCRGGPPPPTLKVGIIGDAGYRNSMTMVFTGLDIEGKIARAEQMLFDSLGGRDSVDAVATRALRATDKGVSTTLLTITVKDRDASRVGRRFSRAVTEMALSSYAGFFCTTPPTREEPYSIFWPTLLESSRATHTVILPDGSSRVIPHSPSAEPPASELRASAPAHSARWSGCDLIRVPLGDLCGARSGDKGGNANVGLWTWDDEAYDWLEYHLTESRLRSLIGEVDGMEIRRWELPRIHALNFEVVGLLGRGVSENSRFDPQAKGLGEFVRAQPVEIPYDLWARLRHVDIGRRHRTAGV